MTKELYKVHNEVFDRRTIKVLDKLRQDYYDELEYCISTGKEANVFRARTKKGFVAVKIFRTYTSSFDNMQKYIIGDPRFSKVKRAKHEIVYVWCKKEFRNLSKSYDARILVPKPIAFKENVIVMEFIGEEGVPASLIKDVNLENPKKVYNEIMNSVKKLYENNLVHADLSEFNILYYKKKPVIIDMAQSVLLNHPNAMQFLEKDVNNINNFFKKRCEIIEWSDFKKELKELSP